MTEQPGPGPVTGVLHLDHALEVVTADPTFCRLFSCKPSDVEGVPFEELLSSRDRKGARRFSRRLGQRRLAGVDTVMGLEIAGDHHLCRVRITATPEGWRFDLENVLLSGNLVYRLLRAQQIARRAVEGIAILDPGCRVVEHNASFFELMSFRSEHGVLLSEEAVLGADLFCLLEAGALAPLQQHLLDPESQMERFQRELRHRERWLEVSSAPLLLPIRGFVGFSVVARDVTLRREREQLLRQKETAEAANTAKSRFLASMSHELRTPLNAILGYSDLLIEEAIERGEAEALADLRKIGNAGSHLLELVTQVLDISKIEAGKMEVWVQSFDVQRLCAEVVETLEPLARRTGNTLSLECAADVQSMRSDKLKLRQVLFNLLSNAIKFTENGQIRLGVERSRADTGDRVLFRVRDTGIGIAPQHLGQLFTDFTQVGAGAEREADPAAMGAGTGLGLALCRQYCRLLGGDVSVESQPAVGSTFTCTLPAEIAGNERPTTARDQPSPAQPPHDPPLQARSDTILMVDDDPAALDLMTRLLRPEGFEVVSCTTPRHCLALARAVRPAAITLDVLMADADGWTVLAALKADPELGHVPVVVLSVIDDRQRALRLGATDHLTKPLPRGRLLQILKRVLNREGGEP